MGFSLKGLFKKKPGGSFLGNVIRGGTSMLSGLVKNVPVIGGVASTALGLVSKLIPDAPPLVQEIAQETIAQAASSPAASPADAKSIASELKAQVLSVGASEAEASAAGAAAFTAASAPTSLAPAALSNFSANIPAGGASFLSKEDIKTIGNGALAGAKEGAIGAYLDGTESGQEAKAAAVDQQGQKAMPFILAGLLLFIFFKRK